jgi:hypothetical protein
MSAHAAVRVTVMALVLTACATGGRPVPGPPSRTTGTTATTGGEERTTTTDAPPLTTTMTGEPRLTTTTTTARVVPPVPVPGVPIDVDPNFQNGSSWREAEENIRAFFKSACGNTECVQITTTTESKTPGDCTIQDHTPAELLRGGTITFVLDSPCATEETTSTTTTAPTTSSSS